MVKQDIGEVLRQGAFQLDKSGIEAARFEARLLLQYLLDTSSAYLLAHEDDLLDSKIIKQYEQWLYRRAQGEPVAYIVGEKEFWSLPLYCNKSTLIPRADTETLIEWVLELELPDNAKVLDLGTGTGAIGLALAFERPRWQLTLVDKIDEAVDLAKKNARRHHLEVEVLQSDWFDSLQGKRFDLIVSNPPYVEPDSAYLHQGDLRFEPLSALTAKEQGMADINYIIGHALNYLLPHGWLLIEHGHKQANLLASEFAKNQYIDIHTKKDLNQLDRVSGARLP